MSDEVKLEILKDKRRRIIELSTILSIGAFTIGVAGVEIYKGLKTDRAKINTIEYVSENEDEIIEFQPHTHYVVRRKNVNDAENKQDIPYGYSIYSINKLHDSDEVDVWYVNDLYVNVNLSNDDKDETTFNDFGEVSNKILSYKNN